ncbi:TPA: hypothetical protein ACH3X1_009217 [Trebouxia sp. C0004]
MGAAVNKNDAMELVSSAELVDPFSEYYESDKIDMDFLTNDKSCNGDIDFEHAAFTNPGVAAAVPTNTRAELEIPAADCLWLYVTGSHYQVVGPHATTCFDEGSDIHWRGQ